MFKKLVLICITTLALTVSVDAASDGDLVLKKNEPSKIGECFENLNRATFALNKGLDKIIFKPVASVYKKFPSPIKSGVSSSLDNLSNLVTIPNNLLQGDFKLAGINTGRLVVNSTIGVLGLFDVASGMGFPEYVKEDYGQTLGTWGVGPGCYLVLPVLGPSTIRDTAGMFVNIMGGDPYYNISVNGNNEYLDGKFYAATKMVSAVELRAANIDSFDNLEQNSVDFYASVKSLYTQDRENKIKNTQRGSIEVIYQEDEDWQEIDTN